MASVLSAPAGASVTHVRRRRWVRRSTPVWPFVWRGLLPLLGLIALGRYALESFAPHDVQASVHNEVRSALDAQGFGWVKLDVSGQNVTLSGEQPAPGRGDAALLLARLTTCPTLAGRLPCTVDVAGRFSDAPAAPPAPAPATAAPTATAPAAAPAAGDAASVAGIAAAPAAGSNAAAPGSAEVAQAARACEAQLAALVALSKIEFDAGAATLKPGSAGVLGALAKAAQSCPGTIRIEGHTDSTGAAASNQALSEARAAAVRRALIERGLPAERLRAQGFGADQPVADNTSADGRAKNRRIEFRIATGQ